VNGWGGMFEAIASPDGLRVWGVHPKPPMGRLYFWRAAFGGFALGAVRGVFGKDGRRRARPTWVLQGDFLGRGRRLKRGNESGDVRLSRRDYRVGAPWVVALRSGFLGMCCGPKSHGKNQKWNRTDYKMFPNRLVLRCEKILDQWRAETDYRRYRQQAPEKRFQINILRRWNFSRFDGLLLHYFVPNDQREGSHATKGTHLGEFMSPRTKHPAQP